MTKKNNSFLFAVVFVAIILLAVSVTAALTNGFSNADPFGWLEDLKSGDVNASGDDLSSGVTDEDGENLESGVLQSMPSQLNFSSQAFAMAQESGASYIEVMLQATVLPEDATNKAVDWSAGWADGSDSSDLSEYLTVTPESDGSTIASVRCYKAFDKKINVIVTTRDGGFTAVCVISYVGENPSSLNVIFDGVTMDDGVYVLSPYSTVSAQLKLSDISGDLSYTNCNFVVSTDFVPSTVTDDVYLVNYKWNKWSGYSLNTDEDFLSYNGSSEQLIHDSVNLSVEGDILTLDVNDYSIMYDSESSGDDLFIYNRVLTTELANTLYANYDRFESTCPYETLKQFASLNEEKLNNRVITVTVTETNSGLSATFKYRITSDVKVSSVSLDKDVIEYSEV